MGTIENWKDRKISKEGGNENIALIAKMKIWLCLCLPPVDKEWNTVVITSMHSICYFT